RPDWRNLPPNWAASSSPVAISRAIAKLSFRRSENFLWRDLPARKTFSVPVMKEARRLLPRAAHRQRIDRKNCTDPGDQSADQNPQTNDHIQGLASAGVRYDHGFQEAPIAFRREGKDQPTSRWKIHRLGFAPFGYQSGPKAWKENCSSVACDRLVARAGQPGRTPAVRRDPGGSAVAPGGGEHAVDA